MNTRLPFAPLARYVGTVYYDAALRRPGPNSRQLHHGYINETAEYVPTRCVAVALGDTETRRRQCQRWAQHGLTLEAAEDVAHALGGAHPTEIWPTYLELVGQLCLDEEWDPPEPEPGGTFCGRPAWYRASGHNDYYGDPSGACEQLRLWEAESGSSGSAA